MADDLEDLGIAAVTPPGLLAFGLPDTEPEEESPFGREPDERPVSLYERMTKAFSAEVHHTGRGIAARTADKATLDNPDQMEALRRSRERLMDESETPRDEETPQQAFNRARAARKRREAGVTIEMPDERRKRMLSDFVEWESLPDSSTSLEYLATTIGVIGANATSPETLILRFPLVGRLFAGSMKPTAAQIAEAMVTQAGVNAAMDPIDQWAGIYGQTQSEYDPARTVLSGILGAPVGGAIVGKRP